MARKIETLTLYLVPILTCVLLLVACEGEDADLDRSRLHQMLNSGDRGCLPEGVASEDISGMSGVYREVMDCLSDEGRWTFWLWQWHGADLDVFGTETARCIMDSRSLAYSLYFPSRTPLELGYDEERAFRDSDALEYVEFASLTTCPTDTEFNAVFEGVPSGDSFMPGFTIPREFFGCVVDERGGLEDYTRWVMENAGDISGVERRHHDLAGGECGPLES